MSKLRSRQLLDYQLKNEQLNNFAETEFLESSDSLEVNGGILQKVRGVQTPSFNQKRSLLGTASMHRLTSAIRKIRNTQQTNSSVEKSKSKSPKRLQINSQIQQALEPNSKKITVKKVSVNIKEEAGYDHQQSLTRTVNKSSQFNEGQKDMDLKSSQRSCIESSQHQQRGFGDKLKETWQERSLLQLDNYKKEWSKHQQHITQKLHVLKNDSTITAMRKKTQSSSQIGQTHRSIIFTGDNFGSRMNDRETRAHINQMYSQNGIIPVQIWYDQLRSSNPIGRSITPNNQQQPPRMYTPQIGQHHNSTTRRIQIFAQTTQRLQNIQNPNFGRNSALAILKHKKDFPDTLLNSSVLESTNQSPAQSPTKTILLQPASFLKKPIKKVESKVKWRPDASNIHDLLLSDCDSQQKDSFKFERSHQ